MINTDAIYQLAEQPVLQGNQSRLLIDGEETFHRP
jgi:hypothetical protein